MSRSIASIENVDPRFVPKEQRSVFERFWLELINDERDLPFIWLSLRMTFAILPAAVLLYVPDLFRWWMAPIYWALVFLVFVDRYMLMLHNTSHRKLFKRRYRLLNKWIPWVLGPFCGQSPDTYEVHHITMHHSEGNLPDDLSSTMDYQRDSILHWLRYFFRFFFGIIFEMTAYQARKKRWKLVRKMLIGELGWYAFAIGMCFVSLEATLVVFVVPFIAIRVLMMMGNWGQHAFVDPDEPDNDYKSSITCINARYNRRCFNDGYHISHHLLANRHWTDHPGELDETREKYVENDAILFEGLDFFMVTVYLLLHRYDTLADHFVELRETPRPREEIIALMKRRLKRFPPQQLAAYSKRKQPAS